MRDVIIEGREMTVSEVYDDIKEGDDILLYGFLPIATAPFDIKKGTKVVFNLESGDLLVVLDDSEIEKIIRDKDNARP